MARKRLRDFMRRRSDGYWELLATAVGSEESVGKTLLGLSADALGSATTGPAVSPTIIEERVQALAAFDPQRIDTLSKTWRPLTTLRRDARDSETDFWMAAWCASFRFLNASPVPYPVGPALLPLAIQRELEFVFGGSKRRFANWEDLLQAARDPQLDYYDLRGFDLSRVARPESVSRADLISLLRTEDRTAPDLGRLRMLTNVPMILSAEGRSYLEELFRERWFTRAEFTTDRGGVVLLMQLVLAFGMDESLRSRSTEHLVTRLIEEQQPVNLAPFAYLLADTKWSCP